MLTQTPGHSSSIGKTLAKCLGFFLLLFILCLLLLPTFFSTRSGKKILLNKISKKNGLHLEIDDLSLSWFGKQEAKGIRLQKPADKLVFNCQDLQTDASLLHLLFKRDVGHLVLIEPYLQMEKPFETAAQWKGSPIKSAGFAAAPSIHFDKKLPFTGTVQIQRGKAAFTPPGIQPIHFDQIEMTLQLPGNEEISLNLNCTTNQAQAQGQIAIKGVASQIDSAFPQATIQTTLTQLPVAGIDQLVSIFYPKATGLLYAAFGDKLDLECHLVALKGNFDINLNIHSPQINGELATQTVNGIVSLKNAANLSINLTPGLLQKAVKLIPSLATLHLSQPVLFQTTLSTFTCPLPKQSEDLLKASFTADITASNEIGLIIGTKPLNLNNFKAKADSPSLQEKIHFALNMDVKTQTEAGSASVDGTLSAGTITIQAVNLPVDLLGALAESPVPLSPYLGPTVNINALMQREQKNPTLQLALASQYLQIPSLQMSMGSNPKLISPANFTLTINPALIPPGQIKLTKAGVIQGTLQELDSSNIKGQLLISELMIGFQDQQLTVEKTSVPFQWNTQTKTGNFEIATDVINPSGKPGSIQGQATISGKVINGSLNLQNLSPLLLDAFTGKTIFTSLMGSTFNAKLKLQNSGKKEQLFLQCISPYLNIESNFVIHASKIELAGSNNQMTWTVTPNSYPILDQMITGSKTTNLPFQLKENTTFSLTLNKLSFPLNSQWKNGLELNATAKNPNLTFFDTTSKDTIQLSNMQFSINQTPNNAPLALSLDCNVTTLATAQHPLKNGSVSLSVKAKNIRNAQGAFDLSQLTGSLQMKVNQFPCRALDIFARAKGHTNSPFTTLFGDSLNASIHTELDRFSGPLAINVNTTMTKVDLAGHFAAGALLLDSPLSVQMKISPEVSRLVLKDVNPLNLSYVYSEAPITLEIPSKGFYLPLYPYLSEKIAIPEATIELGKISCRNEGNVNIALGLLKSKQFEKNGELLLWFAPIDLSVKQGVVEIERTEILLANTFDVCVWGNIDLNKNYVDMVLGLTATTLEKAFGIANLPENYVLTIPMKGPSNNVQINSGKATGKVALLLAWQNKNVAGALGGKAGAIFGDVLGKVATLPDINAKVPPPKHPFPWEIARPGKTSHKNKKKFKAKDNALKQIFKVIR